MGSMLCIQIKNRVKRILKLNLLSLMIDLIRFKLLQRSKGSITILWIIQMTLIANLFH